MIIIGRKKKIIETEQYEIEKISEIEHIRRKPGMYIGSNDTPIQLLFEVCDNAMDECLSGFSKRIDVFNDGDWYVVRDWGRGIPLTSSKMPNTDVPIEIVTKSFSGGKFSNGLYSFSSGLHGIGLTLVNALSTDTQITTIFDKDNYIVYHFEDGEFINKDIILKSSMVKSENFSTEIRFKPDKDYFNLNKINMDDVLVRLKSAKICLSNDVEINFNNTKITETIVEDFLNDNEKNFIKSAESENKDHEETKVFIALTNPDNGKDFRGIVNLIPTNDGTHYRATINVIKELMTTIAQKKKVEIKNADDLLICIKVITVLKLKNPSFDSQTKNKLTTNKNSFESGIRCCITEIIDDYPEFIIEWLRRAEEYRIQLESNKTGKKRKVGRNLIVKGLFECIDYKKDDCDLFLLEGESAGGSMIKCRDPRKHAVLTLRGKPLNAIMKSKSKVLQNDVVNNICAALGYKPYQKVDPDICRYNRVIIAADADADGCFEGSTRIMTPDAAGSHTFEELVNSKTDSIYVYSKDENGQTVVALAKNPRITKYVTELVELDFNGNKIVCTPDHPILLKNGKYIKAENLTEFDSISSLYIRKDDKGYKTYIVKNKKSKFVHTLVNETFNNSFKEALLNDKNYDKNDHKYDIITHHKDGIRTNNVPENLEFQFKKDHSLLHSEDGKLNLINYNKSYIHKSMVSKMNEDTDFKIKQVKGKILKIVHYMVINSICVNEENYNGLLHILSGSAPNFNKSVSYFDSVDDMINLSKSVSPHSGKLANYDSNKILKFRTRILNLFNYMLINNIEINEINYNKLKTSRGDLKWCNILNYFESIDDAITQSKTFNHKISSPVKHITLETPIPVYDITVDKYHNFVVSTSPDDLNGIVVHNSHITALLIALFIELMPELIKAGKLFIVKTPLYGYTKGKQFIPVHDIVDANNLMNSGVKLTRFKGLGEMDPDELRFSAIEPETRRLYRVVYDDIDFKKEWDKMGNLLTIEYETGKILKIDEKGIN